VLDPIPRSSASSERTALANLASLAVARVEALREARSRADLPRTGRAGRRSLEEIAAPAPPRSACGRSASCRARARQPDGAFYLVSPDGVILRWNAALAAAVGYATPRSATMTPMDFISAHDRERGGRGDARGVRAGPRDDDRGRDRRPRGQRAPLPADAAAGHARRAVT
jgi:PAS domain-containing protein